MVIWKQQLPVAPAMISAAIPHGAVFLSAREQGDTISVWYTCNPGPKMETRAFAIVETGATAPRAAHQPIPRHLHLP